MLEALWKIRISLFTRCLIAVSGVRVCIRNFGIGKGRMDNPFFSLSAGAREGGDGRGASGVPFSVYRDCKFIALQALLCPKRGYTTALP